MRTFFLNGLGEKDKLILLVWGKNCKLKKYGGARLRDWSLMNVALGAKMV